MPPYSPPNTHMTLCSAKNFNKTMVGRFIGKNGSNLYKLTDKLKVKYIWFDIEKKQIEIWGPESKLVHAKKIIDEYIEQMEFLDTFNFNLQNKVVKVETRNQSTNTQEKINNASTTPVTKQVWRVKQPQVNKPTKQVWRVKI
mgnify:CR=1 FL=1